MKNFWKWILGIVVVLVVLFVLGIGARLLMVRMFPASAIDYDGYRFPMMMGGRGLVGFGMPHFNMGFMRLGGLLPLALLGLVIYGAFWLGKRKNQGVDPTVVPATPAPQPTCSNCGSLVQEGWNHCASCGNKL